MYSLLCNIFSPDRANSNQYIQNRQDKAHDLAETLEGMYTLWHVLDPDHIDSNSTSTDDRIAALYAIYGSPFYTALYPIAANSSANDPDVKVRKLAFKTLTYGYREAFQGSLWNIATHSAKKQTKNSEEKR
ncbi:hypothetical protein [Poriferisphaera sp. WC338]|uniref:hypothetical protein n=1 Tax=Poriferisphaera sp. WC338 TaxID=3425129 RepID=UPI003D81595B